jgi:cell division protein FtsQ
VLCLCVFGCAWAVAAVYQTWESDPARLKEPVRTVPLKQVVFATDGVLERAWLDQTLALPKGASLMTLDLSALESRLLASRQAQRVVLRRRFTDNALVVTVRERVPIARIMVQIGGAAPRMQLVAHDGVVYEGAGYGWMVLEQLPWLDGVRLRRASRGGFEPIENMEPITGLLSAAQGLVPQLCAGWQVVSLVRLASDQEIIVRSREIPEIIFDAREDFPRQLAKLDYIVDTLRAHGAPVMARVNLALGSQVPVELQNSTPLTPATLSLSRTTLKPSKKRDF